MSLVADRDAPGGMCVCCGERGASDDHHRILGNTADDRLSNLLRLRHACHMRWHQREVRRARELGYIVSRHGPREATLEVPVWYDQPQAARVGWYRLDDAGQVEGPLDQPPPPVITGEVVEREIEPDRLRARRTRARAVTADLPGPGYAER